MRASIFVLVVFSCASAHSQSYSISVMPGVAAVSKERVEVVDSTVFYGADLVEKYAEPVMGWSAFHEKLSKQAYPAEAKKKGEEADVFVAFKVDRSGKAEVTKVSDDMVFPDSGDCESCMELTKQLIEEIEWQPAQIGNTNVNSKDDMIISFVINEGN